MVEEKDKKTEETKTEEKETEVSGVSAEEGEGLGDKNISNDTSNKEEKKEAAVSDKPAVVAKKKKKKFRRQVLKGKAFVRSTYNNTVVSLMDMHGGLLAWSSAGLLGFKGAKKATTFAAAQVVNDVNEKVQKYGLSDIEVYVKGVGSGREAAVRALAQKGYNLVMIKDITPIPHNGCRPKKPRRV
jgi:small subunit ribosomal protein S11